VGFGRRHIRLLRQGGAGAPWEVEVAFKSAMGSGGGFLHLIFHSLVSISLFKDVHYLVNKFSSKD
jgi:hypothetical protein